MNSFLTNSPAVKKILKYIEQIIQSNSDAPILILGETGVGKEVLAKHIALRLNQNVVTANMGCIPKDTAESILFGHERGAFTGAVTDKVGLIESAHNGIFFLDEIGETPAAVQTKLLRVLQEKEIHPLGAKRSKKIHVRFIAATHCNLGELAKTGNFRLDLLQRLNTFTFKIPSLRDRPEDILLFANMFLEKFKGRNLSEDGKKELLAYSWPGNVRELYSVIERIGVLFFNKVIDHKIVREAIAFGQSDSPCKVFSIQETLQKCNGNKIKAARELNISTSTLYRRMRECVAA